MASTTEDGAFEAEFPDNKLTLYLAQDGGHVVRVTFHDTSSWCHEITWTCTLIPDNYSPLINHHKFRQRLSALKEQFATHGRLTSIQFDRWMFVFGHATEDIADDMLSRYTSLKEIILKFLHDIDAHVTDITMKSQVKTVDAAAVRRDQGPETAPGGTTDHDIPCTDKHDVDEDASHSHPQKKEGSTTYTGMTGNSRAEHSFAAGQANIGNTHINIYICESSGKAACRTSWKTTNDIPQRTFIDFESLATQLEQMFNAILVRVRRGSMVFCFEHESKEDATNMIIRHAEVKEVILHFLQELDPSIQDIRMKVEFRELCQPEEQTTDTSETRPVGRADPEHKDEEGASHSRPQQKDETSHPNIKDKDDSRLHIQKMYVKDTSHSHPLTSHVLGTSHSHPQHAYAMGTYQPHLQTTYEEGTFKYQPIGIKEGSTTYTGMTGNSRAEHSFAAGQANIVSASSDPSLKPLVKGQDSDRHASSDPSQGQSWRRRYLWLSTASHATPSRADRDLYYASKDGDLEEVKRLLSTPGVDINSRVDSLTPVMIAAYKSHSKVVELLVGKGADVSLVDDNCNNTLHIACGRNNVETVKFVLSLNVVDINSRGMESQTPVMRAAQYRHRDVVELLVSEGADVSLVDVDGNNTLHFACRGGDVETVEFVLSLNVVDIDARNNYGRTAAAWARLGGHQPVAELLKSRGAQ